MRIRTFSLAAVSRPIFARFSNVYVYVDIRETVAAGQRAFNIRAPTAAVSEQRLRPSQRKKNTTRTNHHRQILIYLTRRRTTEKKR